VIHEDEDFGGQRDYKAERDTLIDDIAVLRTNNKRYRTRAENAMELAERANCEVLRLEVVESNYNALTHHIRQKAEANPNVDRYIALVNYIDKLERD
jgi:hypothetical protein